MLKRSILHVRFIALIFFLPIVFGIVPNPTDHKQPERSVEARGLNAQPTLSGPPTLQQKVGYGQDAALVNTYPTTGRQPLRDRRSAHAMSQPKAGWRAKPAASAQYIFNINLDYDHHRLDAAEQVHFTNAYTQSISQIVFNVPPAHDRAQFDLWSVQLDQVSALYQFTAGALTITLPFDLEPNASIDLSIDFTVYIPALTDAQSFASTNLAYTDEATNIGYWYPILAPFRSGKWTIVPWHPIGDPFASDIADYTATITATPGVTLVAGGSLSHQSNVWHTALDRARTLGMFASPHYHEAQVAFNGVTYSVYTFDRHTLLAWPALYTLIRAIQLDNLSYGAYPYPTLRAAEVSGPWSMEFSGLVAIGSTDFDGYDNRTHNRLFRIIAHEVSHQWWYNLVGDDQAREPWLDEGFARFNELRFYEFYSPKDAQWWWTSIIEPWPPDAPIDLSIYAFNDHRRYLTDVYNQGAQFLAALRTRIGAGTFNAFLRDLFQREAYGMMTTADFFNVLRDHTKVNLSSLLRRYFSRKYWQR